ncbi:uncharacterized protein [Palaemon carinicauda]|uniref:uncharacterized protein n=1 Tax=Palaemon carinicauda TaxID=392227 RepID=UPI0035B6738C
MNVYVNCFNNTTLDLTSNLTAVAVPTGMLLYVIFLGTAGVLSTIGDVVFRRFRTVKNFVEDKCLSKKSDIPPKTKEIEWPKEMATILTEFQISIKQIKEMFNIRNDEEHYAVHETRTLSSSETKEAFRLEIDLIDGVIERTMEKLAVLGLQNNVNHENRPLCETANEHLQLINKNLDRKFKDLEKARLVREQERRDMEHELQKLEREKYIGKNKIEELMRKKTECERKLKEFEHDIFIFGKENVIIQNVWKRDLNIKQNKINIKNTK